MQKNVQVDWDTIRDVLRGGTRDEPVGVGQLAEQVGYRLGKSPEDAEIRERILASANELAQNGFIDAPYPFEEDSVIAGLHPRGRELFEWMDEERSWNRLRPGLEEALRSGLGAEHQHLSAKALDSALRQAGVR